MEDHHQEEEEDSPRKSFLLIDENELMQIESAEDFALKLGCSPTTLVKVVSIFGSIGHGKSYTLNHTFYSCDDVFETSSTQDSCTIGIWAAYDAKRRVITIDTEGLLGVSSNCQRRTRLLLKVLAITDIVIYRTRSERLEDNLFTFLGDASRVYIQHFSKELRNAFQKMPENTAGYTLSDLGPVVLIFHETRDTEPLTTDAGQTRESIIRKRFTTLGLTTEAFSAIEYVGIQTPTRPTNFDQLKQCIKRQIKNSSVRTARPISVIYTTIKLLNEKFNGDIEKTVPSMFSNQYLTCSTVCLSCNARCINSMNHHRDGQGHKTDTKCKYQHQFNNHILYCRACYERGDDVIVMPKTCSSNESPWLGLAKYAWAGYVLECSICGVIYRSRQYWFGNKDTWDSSVRTDIRHVWPGELNKMQAPQNAAQRVLDSVNYLTETVTNISAKPTKMVSEWVADQIAPTYWIPNSRILHCALCGNEFGQLDQKHHCRLCGNGLCSTCSSKSKPVPERGWGETSVRVCDRCYERSDHLATLTSLPPLPPQSIMHNLINQNNTTNNCYANINNATPLYNNHFDNLASSQQQQQQQQQLQQLQQLQQQPHQISSSAQPPSPPSSTTSNKNSTKKDKNTKPIPIVSSSSNSSSNNNSSNDHNINQLFNNNQSSSASTSSGSSPTKLYNDGVVSHINHTNSIDNTTNNKMSITNNNMRNNNYGLNGDQTTVTARKFGEVLQSTLKTVVSAIDYPLGVIKDSARPDYWTPDSQITECGLCKQSFNDLVTIHHCRRCGGGFCHECSTKAKPVPERGWGDASVRVCDKCHNLD